jgi:DUF4097 and DUF4098 domain-containing protein YvlB
MVKLRVLASAAVLALGASACSINLSAEQWVGTEKKSFPVTGKAEVNLKTFDGSIEVTTWDRPEVGLVIERKAGSQAEGEALKVTSTQDGNRITVEAVKPEREVQVGYHVGRSVKFIVNVPRTTDLVARTGDGSITVADVSGRLELRSGDGSIKGTGLGGEVSANTGDGSITLEGVKGVVDVNTGDGSVHVAGAPTALKAHTGDGSVTLDVDAGASLTRDWEITTGDGGVKISLPSSVNADLDASTGDGGISAADFGLETSADNRDQLSGRLGSGGPKLKVRTGDGSITVAKK